MKLNQMHLSHRQDTVNLNQLDTISENKRKCVRKRVSNDLKVWSSAQKTNFVSEKHVPKISVVSSSHFSSDCKPYNLKSSKNGFMHPSRRRSCKDVRRKGKKSKIHQISLSEAELKDHKLQEKINYFYSPYCK